MKFSLANITHMPRSVLLSALAHKTVIQFLHSQDLQHLEAHIQHISFRESRVKITLFKPSAKMQLEHHKTALETSLHAALS